MDEEITRSEESAGEEVGRGRNEDVAVNISKMDRIGN